MCRKVALASDEVEVWGDGLQTRSFLYIDDCVEAVYRLVQSDFHGPVNIGSEELISINNLARKVMEVSGKYLKINHIEGPQGVRGRKSDNKLIFEKLHWKPSIPLEEGLKKTYDWISQQLHNSTDKTDLVHEQRARLQA